MATYLWTGAAGDGNWSTAGNWNPDTGVPGADDTVTIDLSVAGAINISNQAVLDLTINKFVTLDVNDNTSFTFGAAGSAAATFANSGTLALNSTNDATVLLVASPTLSLTGTGTLLLDNNVSNYIVAAAAGNELNDVSNLIEGAGQIGNGGDLNLLIGTAAVLDANQSADIYLNTGTATTMNSGLMEATGAGGLRIETAVNSGTLGRITAAGANVYLQGGDIQGGTIASTGGAAFVNIGNGTLDGSAHTVTNTGSVVVNDSTSLDLLGTITNKGTISLNSSNDSTTLAIGSNAGSIVSTVTLTGSGQVVLDNNPSNYIAGGITGDTLVNLNNTISGGGTFASSLVLVNDGTIDANAAGAALVIDTSANVSNTGTLEATLATGSGLVINSVISSGTAGIVLASGGNVYLQNGSLQGGTIKTSGGGEVIETATGTLDGTNHAVTNLGTVTVDDNDQLYLLGTIVNNGTIALTSTNDSTELLAGSATVSLTGTGVISLDNNSNNYIFGSPSTDELDNVSNTIEGAGQIGGGAAITLVNGTHGVIDGNLSAGLTLNVGPVAVANSGLIEATAGGALTIDRTTVNDSTGGTILASTANVDLNGAIIEGGLIASSGGGVVVAVGGSNLLDGTSQTVTLKGTVVVDDNQDLGLAGTITNDGSIESNSTNDTTLIEVVSASVTLTGGGTVVLDDNGSNDIYGAAATDVLDNLKGTIEGSGRLGDGQLTLINASAGTISATGTNSQLVINTGTIAVTNSGLIEAVGPAGLLIQNTTINNGTLGVISAAHGVVYLNGATIQGGEFTESGAGSFATFGGATLDGTAHTVTNKGQLTVDDNNALTLLGTITNTGTIILASSNDSTDLILGPSTGTGTVTLTGSGQIAMYNNVNNYIYGSNGGSTTLINLNNTISGGGTLGYNGLLVTNDGVIDANVASSLTIDGSSVVTNNKLIESTGTGGLLIRNTTISNGTAGTLAAAGGAVTIGAADIIGGTLTGTGGFYTYGGSTLDGTTHTVVNDALLTLDDNNTLNLLGTITNAGTITLGSTNDSTSLILGASTGTSTLTLTGGGQVVLNNNPNNYIYGDNGGSTVLLNLNNTISGAGTLGYNGLGIINDSVIDANAANTLTIDGGGTVENNDLIESTSAGGLVISNVLLSNGASGTIAAAGGAVTLAGAEMFGGTFTGTGGFYTYGGSALVGLVASQPGTSEFVNQASITVDDNNVLYLWGTFDNTGAITLASTNDSTSLIIGPNGEAGTVSLTGGGNLVLSDNPNNYVYGYSGAQSTLINVDNTISGAGTLGYNGLLITNDSLIDANGGNRLTIDGSSTLTNNGLIESTGTGGLLILNTTISNGAVGTISALGGNVTVQGATIEGGLITSTGPYAVYANSGAVFGATTGTLTNTGNIVVQDNNNVYLAGAIDNTGTITVASTNDATQLFLDAPTVTLTGTGTIVLGNNPNNYLNASTAGGVLDNVGNTIEGAGHLGYGDIGLINGGIIDANYSNTLTLSLSSTGTNLAGGQFLGTGSGGLLLSQGTFTNVGLIQADDGSSVTFGSGASLTNNANNGTLTGGSYGAVSTGDGATLSITGSAVSTLAATIILSGAGSTIEFAGATIDSTLGSIAAGGTLSLQNGYQFTVAANSGTLADNGLISLSASTLKTPGTNQGSPNSLLIGTGGAVSGFGTVTANVLNAGTLAASGGTLLFNGYVSGTGDITAAASSVVDLYYVDLGSNNVLSQTISGAGTLQLDNESGFTEDYALSGGDITIATVEVDEYAGITGYGTLAGALIDNGQVFAEGGTFVVGGAIRGAGYLGSENGALLDLAGGGTFAGTIGGGGDVTGPVDIAGALTLTAGAVLDEDVTESANITLASVSVTNTASNTFTIAASSGHTVTLGSTGTGSTFTNLGYLQSSGPGTTDIATTFIDTGIIAASSGTLLIAGALSGSGTITAAVNTVVDLTTSDRLTEVISGPGTLQLDHAAFLLEPTQITVATLKIDAGASLSGADTFADAIIDNGTLAASGVGGTLLITGALSGTGTLSAGVGAVVDLKSGDKLTETISGAGTLQLDGGSYSLAAGHVTIGTLTVESGAALSGTGTLAGKVIDSGSVTASGGTLLVSGALSGSGTLAAASGAVLDIKGGGSFSGAIQGAGTVDIAGKTTLDAGATFTATDALLTADLTLDGTSITTAAGNDFTITAATLTTIGLFGAGSGGTFTNHGSFVANGAGTAYIGVAFVNDGTATVTSGALRLTNTLSGTGTVSAAAGAVVDLIAGANFAGALSGAGTIAFADGTSTLAAGASLSAADVIDTANLTLKSVSITNAASSFFTITAASGATDTIAATGTGSKFTNAGTLLANGAGTADISAPFDDTGTASVTSGTLLIAGALSGSGTLAASAGAVLDIKDGGSFSGAVQAAGTVEIAGKTTLDAGATFAATDTLLTADLVLTSLSITNAASSDFTITAAAGATTGLFGAGSGGKFTNNGSFTANGAGTAYMGVAFVDDGTASVTSGALRISNTLSGTGTLSASAGAVVDMIAGADFAGALTGAGTLAIAAASVLNTGASLSATHVTETANLTLKSVSISNMASHAYTITAASGATVTLASSGTGSSFTNAGSLAVAGAGTADVSAPFINAGLVSASAGTLSFIGTVSNTGTIDAASALVTIKTDVSGTGTLDVGATGTLSLLAGAGSGQVVDFLAGTGLLDLTQPLDFAGTISGFGSSDKIDLLNTLETTYTYANHILTVKDGSATVAHLDFAGSSNSFSLTGDTHGGTLITFG